MATTNRSASTSSMIAGETTADECDLLINSTDNNDDKSHLQRIQPKQANTYNNTGNGYHLLSKLFHYLANHHSSSRVITNRQQTLYTHTDKVAGGGDDRTRSGAYNYLGNPNQLYQQSKLDRLGAKSEENRAKSYKRRKCRLVLTISILSILLFSSIFLLTKLLILIREQRESVGFVRKLDSSASMANDYLGERKRRVEHQHGAQEVDRYEDEASIASRWLVSSPKCRIPNIDAWHEYIKSYVEIKPELNCTEIFSDNGGDKASLSYVKDNRLYFTKFALKIGALHDCCYREITRSEENDDDLIYGDNCTTINQNGLEAPFELIKLECDKHNYTNIHVFTVEDREEKEALQRIAARRLKANQYYNILMVGVDTISRLNGIRQLNKTLALLRDKYKTLDFGGYNKVGENTFPNLIPLLTGLRPEQLTETQCWLASNYSQESETGDDYLDNCKYLWNYYQEFGYMTYFSEDWPKVSTFNYLKQGFKREPTAYYGRPFTLARDHLLLPPVKMGCASCLLDKPIVDVDLENLKSFIHSNNDAPHFAFHWINCPQHDDLNGASQVDNILKSFFNDIYEDTQDRTFVIFFSDHGYRWNNFVSTRIGHYEASLPLMTISAPKHFIEKHPDLYENLKAHQSALFTPFDMFKTLVDIRNLAMRSPAMMSSFIAGVTKSSNGSSISKLNQQSTKHERDSKTSVIELAESSIVSTKPPINRVQDELLYTTGPTASTTIRQLQQQDGLHYKQDFKIISLLKRHNSTELDRSCIEAGIPDNYCVCHEFENIDITTNDVLGAAYYFVYVHMYNIIKDHFDICHFLQLETIHKAELFDFRNMKATTKSPSRQKRDNDDINSDGDDHGANEPLKFISTTTTPEPPIEQFLDDDGKEIVIDERHYLPNREYNVRVSTKPGGALLQEVIRYYGEDIKQCKSAVGDVRKVIEDPSKDHYTKHVSVVHMNSLCKFSIHSDSISRLNLYKDQSKCVTHNNIELKKCVEDMKNISADSLNQELAMAAEAASSSSSSKNLPQVIDVADTESETSTSSPFIDRSFGPALVAAATPSFDSPAITGGRDLVSAAGSAEATPPTPTEPSTPFAQDGDMMATTITNNHQTTYRVSHIESPMIREEAEEYADDLARELIDDTNRIVRSEHSAVLKPRSTTMDGEGGGEGEVVGLQTGGQEERVQEPPQKQESSDGGGQYDNDDYNNEESHIESAVSTIAVEETQQRDNEDLTTTTTAVTAPLTTTTTTEQLEVDSKRDKEEEILEDSEREEEQEEEIENTLDASENNNNNFNPNDSLRLATNILQDAHQSFQTAAGTSLLVDCDKLLDMEFTKNYSDDLLMGQNDGVQQGEITSAGADLADFELPPYSGSSSGSEPRQHSPVKRKSSSGAQESSSSSQQQVNAAAPDLTAVKDLLMSGYSRVSHVFHWKRPIESGVFFAIGVALLTAITFFSIISVVAYSALGVILTSGLIRLYKAIMKALNRSSETPFDHIWNQALSLNVSLSPEKMHELVDASHGNMNASLVYFRQVLLVEDKIATFKFGLFLYSLTYIGAWFNGMTLITISYLALFLVPIFYEKNKTKIDEYLNLASGQISSAISMISNKVTSLAFGSTPIPSTSGGGKKQN